jgi:hypothetical protein
MFLVAELTLSLGADLDLEPIPAPDLILLLGSPELKVDFDNILEPFLELGLFEPRCKAGKGELR